MSQFCVNFVACSASMYPCIQDRGSRFVWTYGQTEIWYIRWSKLIYSPIHLHGTPPVTPQSTYPYMEYCPYTDLRSTSTPSASLLMSQFLGSTAPYHEPVYHSVVFSIWESSSSSAFYTDPCFKSNLTHHSRFDSYFTIPFDSDFLVPFDSHCKHFILIWVTSSDSNFSCTPSSPTQARVSWKNWKVKSYDILKFWKLKLILARILCFSKEKKEGKWILLSVHHQTSLIVISKFNHFHIVNTHLESVHSSTIIEIYPWV